MGQDWNLGEKKKKGLVVGIEKAILVALHTDDQTEEQVQEYLDELEFLAMTAGAKTIKTFVQRRNAPHKSTFIGKGKLEEIQRYIEENEDINLVIFDDDLSGKQTNIIEEELKRKILDRSTLILDIFASRAQTAQAKTQVELAQMQYLLPRLRGLWTHLERQRGGIGMRGPGEKEIETDRRIVRDKVSRLKAKLAKIDQQSQTQRKRRGEMVRVSLVGYTNAGKSTLMNLLGKAKVFAENKLFATLDTTVRKVVIGAMPFLMSDTVGFIRKLPHHLVESFKSTLDEVRESDILLHVVDVSHNAFEDHVKTVQKTLEDLGAQDKPTLMIYNKVDLYRKKRWDEFLTEKEKKEVFNEFVAHVEANFGKNYIFISAKESENIDQLRATMKTMIEEMYQIRYPYVSRYW